MRQVLGLIARDVQDHAVAGQLELIRHDLHTRLAEAEEATDVGMHLGDVSAIVAQNFSDFAEVLAVAAVNRLVDPVLGFVIGQHGSGCRGRR